MRRTADPTLLADLRRLLLAFVPLCEFLPPSKHAEHLAEKAARMVERIDQQLSREV